MQMKLTLILALTVLALMSATGCHSETRSEGVSAKQETTPSAALDVASACERLKDIKILPRKDDDPYYRAIGGDPAYNALLAAGENAIPCLIRKINDQTMMDDPRQAPKVGKVAVGDVAFFVLVDSGKIGFVDLLPPAVQKAYEHDGVYGYFRLIDEDDNRQKLQAAAIKWYEQKYGRSLANQ